MGIFCRMGAVEVETIRSLLDANTDTTSSVIKGYKCLPHCSQKFEQWESLHLHLLHFVDWIEADVKRGNGSCPDRAHPLLGSGPHFDLISIQLT